MSSGKRRIGVLPFGEVPEVALRVIAANIAGSFDLQADVLPFQAEPQYAYDERRFQYDALALLQAVGSMPFDQYEKVIGVLDVDLFIPILTHVFGEAEQDGRYALVSLHRLRRNSDGSNPPMPLLLERTAKVALHELGHLYSLVHCTDSKCLMHFSGGLQTLDEIPLYFCRYCSRYLQDSLGHPKMPKDQGDSR
jgi:archaemetzincin